MKNIIQVAGIIDKEEAALIMQSDVDYLGFPLRLPVNAVDHTEEEAKEIIKDIHDPFQSVLISYQNEATDIIQFCDFLSIKVVQLHGDIDLSELKIIKSVRPDIMIFKSLVIGEYSNDKLHKMVGDLSQYVDAFITDTYNPKTGQSGATGLTHDWDISQQLVKLSPKPVILAGGLNAGNVYDAIIAVQPAGVDVHTGIEGVDGRKNCSLLNHFVTEAKRGFKQLQIE